MNTVADKTVTTKHSQIGYAINVSVIADALREEFGMADESYVLMAVAAHIWSVQCTNTVKTWGKPEIVEAINRVKARIAALESQISA